MSETEKCADCPLRGVPLDCPAYVLPHPRYCELARTHPAYRPILRAMAGVLPPRPAPPPPEARARPLGATLDLVSACPHRGGVLPLSLQREGCGCGELSACAAGKGRDGDGRVSLRECIACVESGGPPPPREEDPGDRLDARDLDGIDAPEAIGLVDAGGDLLDVTDRWRGKPAYFLGGGPSLASVDLAALAGPDVLTIAVNNVARIARPKVWTCVDGPDGFPGPHWDDPEVLKVVPRAFADQGWHPNTAFYLRNCRFRADRFLTEPTFNWGCDAKVDDGLGNKGGRSVMLVALRLLHLLGASKVYLLGCDFHMDPARPYAHDQAKDAKGCASNNDKFRILDLRFRALRPHLEAAGMPVYNATPGSGLGAFESVSPEAALGDARACSR